jgi:hypothetical protein
MLRDLCQCKSIGVWCLGPFPALGSYLLLVLHCFWEVLLSVGVFYCFWAFLDSGSLLGFMGRFPIEETMNWREEEALSLSDFVHVLSTWDHVCTR